MSENFEIGDLVWAKMKGYHPWPGRVVKPGPNTKKPPKKSAQWIYFFGSNNYAWIENSRIKPYHENKEKLSGSTKTALFKQALENIEEFIENKKENPDYELDLDNIEKIENESEEKPKPSSAKKPRKSIKRQSENSSTKNSPIKKVRKSPKPEENGSHFYQLNEDFLDVEPLRAETPTVDLKNVSEAMKSKNISASSSTFGFMGLGVMGSGMIKNLINSGHRVNIWNRSMKKCEAIKAQADANKSGLVEVYTTPCDVVQNSDIIFCCVSDPQVAGQIIFGNCGVLSLSLCDDNALQNKGYVEMTGIDAETSLNFYKAIKSKGGRYLEAQMQGSRKEADEGNLVVLTAGDRPLFDDCQTCFQAIGKTAFFLGDVGYAAKMNMVINLMNSIALVGLAEGLILADRCGLSSKNVLEIFNVTNMACPYLKGKADRIIKRDFANPEHAIQHMQKDIKLCLDLSNNLKQPLSMAATANEVFKHARRLGYDGQDCSCIYLRSRY